MDIVKVGLAGCGSVSQHYLPSLQKCPYAELVSVCDSVMERAEGRAREFNVPHVSRDARELLAGPEIDLFVNCTSFQAHYALNKIALNAAKHVFSEKPFAGTVEEAQELIRLAKQKGLRIWATPAVTLSPQFRCMAEILASGEIGSVHAAHGCYGSSGPHHPTIFDQDKYFIKGGGSLFDLGVYNITTLTSLLGPAKSVVAFAGAAIPERLIKGKPVQVEVDDNAMLLMDHGNAVYSHIQSGFVYYNQNKDHTVELIGTKGAMNLLGFDWEPKGVQVFDASEHRWQTRCADPKDYLWGGGAAYATKCLVTEEINLMPIELALHVLEIMLAALKSAETGQRIPIKTTFPWPLIGSPNSKK